MNFFNKKNKINLKKILLIITSVFLISIMNFKYNNIFALQIENIDDLKKNIETTDLNKLQCTDGHQVYLNYQKYIIDNSDNARYYQINDFIKTQIKPWFNYYQETLSGGDVSDKCMASIMNHLKTTFLNPVDDIRNKVSDGFFIVFFTFDKDK